MVAKIFIDTIAEILIKKTDLQNKKNQRAILSDFKALKKQNTSRVPNCVLIALAVCFTLNVDVFWCNVKTIQDYNCMELKLEHYKSELQKIQNKNKK